MDDGYAIHWSVLVDGQGISEGPSPRGGPEVLAICCCCRQIILLTTAGWAHPYVPPWPGPFFQPWGDHSRENNLGTAPPMVGALLFEEGLYPLSTEWAHAKQGVPNHLGRQFDSLLRMVIRR